MNQNDIEVKMKPIFGRFGVRHASVFGSVARGEAKPDSDVDLLVEFVKMPSLVQFIQFEDALKQAVNRDVDVVVKGTEKLFIKSEIEKDLVTIYE